MLAFKARGRSTSWSRLAAVVKSELECWINGTARFFAKRRER